MIMRRFLAVVMATSVFWNPALAHPTVLGMVMDAKRVHLNSVAVTSGSTVYDGDGFSTEEGGMLFLRIATVMLRLNGESAMIVRSKANGARGTKAELSKGTLVFSAIRGSAIEMVTLGARICPAADAPTVAQVSVTGPKELLIYASRGALQFSYKGETEAIEEGKAYRVILDPPGNESKRDKKEPMNDRKKKAFLFLISEAGVIAIIYGLHEAFEYESPERP